MTKAQTKIAIQDRLETDNQYVIESILAIYARQTADEQSSNLTTHLNGRGFNGRDAEFGSSLAKQIQKWQQERKYPTPLTDRQMRPARRMMKKYWNQLSLVETPA